MKDECPFANDDINVNNEMSDVLVHHADSDGLTLTATPTTTNVYTRYNRKEEREGCVHTLGVRGERAGEAARAAGVSTRQF